MRCKAIQYLHKARGSDTHEETISSEQIIKRRAGGESCYSVHEVSQRECRRAREKSDKYLVLLIVKRNNSIFARVAWKFRGK